MSLRHKFVAAALLLGASLLVLTNLAASVYWHDEAPTAAIGHNLLTTGDIIGWDGRNLVGGTNGRTLTAELRDPLPPLMYAATAGGIALFGYNRFGTRILHALAGLVALGMFYLVLRQHLARHPRLILFCFTFVTLSTQLLLFLRQARYFALALLGVIAIFYCYERFWRKQTIGNWVVLTAVAVISFFGHYLICITSVGALAIYHLLLRTRQTPIRVWVLFVISGLVTLGTGLGYLAWLGAAGDYIDHTGVIIDFELSPIAPLIRVYIYLVQLFTLDWISWPVGLWFALALAALGWRGQDNKVANWLGQQFPSDMPLRQIGSLVLYGLLVVLLTGLLSVQPIKSNEQYHLGWIRYFFIALPFLLVMKGLFIERLWQVRPALAGTLLVVMLSSNVAAVPFNAENQAGESTLDLHLARFVQEVWRPRVNGQEILYDVLRSEANQDDMVYIEGAPHIEAMIAQVGDKVLMCCHIDEKAASLVTRLNAPYLAATTDPDWIILLGGAKMPEKWEGQYLEYASTEVFAFGVSPEMFAHIWAPWTRNYLLFAPPSLLLQRKE